MTLDIGRFTPAYEAITTPPAAPPRPSVDLRAPAAARSGDTVLDEVPPVPTSEARAEVERARDRIEELHAQDRTLHFSRDESSNRVVIEVRDLTGNVIRTIPPSKALDVMSGGKL